MNQSILKFGILLGVILVLTGLIWADAWLDSSPPAPTSIPLQTPKHSPLQTHKHANTQTPKHLKTNKTTFRQTNFDTYLLQLDTANIQFFWRTQAGQRHHSIRDIALQLEENQQSLLFATNGGMFTPSFKPVGLYIEQEKVLQNINLKNEKGNFFMQPNGVFGISKEGTAHIFTSQQFNENWEENLQYATQSGPMLLIEGKIHPKFGKKSINKNIRSGVGIIDSKTLVFAISNKPVNFYDFASLFLEEFGCQNALYLDGVISEMYLPELGRWDSTGKFGVIIGVGKKYAL